MKHPVPRMLKYSKILEDRFFLAENEILRERLTTLKKKEESMQTLSEVSGIKNHLVLQQLVDLDIRPEILAALCLIPIIEVAWADGSVDKKERDAILEAANKNLFRGDEDILREWLQTKPNPKLMEAWELYMQGLCDIIDDEAISLLKHEIISHTKSVAEASGGFLGLINPISNSEQKMIEKIKGFFAKPGTCYIDIK